MAELIQAGIFQAIPLEWAIKETTNKAIQASIKFHITASWNDVESRWDDWSQYEQHTTWGNFVLITKDGNLNSTVYQRIMDTLGWDGDITTFDAGEWNRVLVQITVKPNMYNNNMTYRADWIDRGDKVPVMQSNVDDGSKRAVMAKHGSAIRALNAALNKANGSAPVNGAPVSAAPVAPRPASPPSAAPATAPVQQPVPVAAPAIPYDAVTDPNGPGF